METINDVKVKYMNMRDKFQELELKNKKLRECVERIANKKWFGEVQDDARKTLEEINKL